MQEKRDAVSTPYHQFDSKHNRLCNFISGISRTNFEHTVSQHILTKFFPAPARNLVYRLKNNTILVQK